MKGFSNFPENFCVEWVQMRKYLACVFYMPILLRICRSESTHETPNFLGNYDFFKSPPQHLLQPSLKLQLIPLS